MASASSSAGLGRNNYVHQWFENGLPSLPIRGAQQSQLQPRAMVHQHGTHGTSMMMTGNPSLAALTSAPTVSTYSSTGRHGAARSASQQRLLAEDGTGALQPRPVTGPVLYDCYMRFLDCKRSFRDTGEWKKHCLSHFKGAGPPPRNKCCFCEKIFTGNGSQDSWNKLMTHLATIHFRLGERTSRTARPDFELYAYLRRADIISNQQWKDLQGSEESRTSAGGVQPLEGGRNTTAASSKAAPYTVTNDNNRRRR